MGHIVIISGPPGAGKSTVARVLAENSPYERSIHVHTDDFYGYIRKGYIEPWRSESNEQNIAVSKAMASCAKSFAAYGYEVIVDGVIGPWYLTTWIETATGGTDVHYAILRPDLETTLARNAKRKKEIDPTIITHMWNDFADLGLYESHAMNTANQSPEKTADSVRLMLNEGCLSLIK